MQKQKQNPILLLLNVRQPYFRLQNVLSGPGMPPILAKARDIKEGGAHPLSMITCNSAVFPFQAAQ